MTPDGCGKDDAEGIEEEDDSKDREGKDKTRKGLVDEEGHVNDDEGDVDAQSGTGYVAAVWARYGVEWTLLQR